MLGVFSGFWYESSCFRITKKLTSPNLRQILLDEFHVKTWAFPAIKLTVDLTSALSTLFSSRDAMSQVTEHSLEYSRYCSCK